MALEKKIIHEDEKVVLFNCASGLKYPIPDLNQTIDKNSAIKYSQFT
jgi:threonine synthase